MGVEFKHANEEQACNMFGSFYPDASAEQCKQFAKTLFSALGEAGEQVSAAALQHFFIQNRKRTHEEAIAKAVGDVLEDLKQRESDKARGDAANDKDGKKTKTKKKKKKKGGDEADEPEEEEEEGDSDEEDSDEED